MRPAVAVYPKKPYQPPKLFVYGSLIEMTQARSNRGGTDSAKSGARRKTGA